MSRVLNRTNGQRKLKKNKRWELIIIVICIYTVMGIDQYDVEEDIVQE